MDVAQNPEEVEARLIGERRVHRLAEGHDLGEVADGEDLALGDRAGDNERGDRVGRERERVGRQRRALEVDQARDRHAVHAVGERGKCEGQRVVVDHGHAGGVLTVDLEVTGVGAGEQDTVIERDGHRRGLEVDVASRGRVGRGHHERDKYLPSRPGR